MKSKIKTALAAVAFIAAMPIASAFAADHAVTISNFKFEPANIEVAAGDTVTFTNKDSAPHTATALDGSFDTGRLNKDQSATITISDAGDINYKCNFHGAMKGVIVAK